MAAGDVDGGWECLKEDCRRFACRKGGLKQDVEVNVEVIAVIAEVSWELTVSMTMKILGKGTREEMSLPVLSKQEVKRCVLNLEVKQLLATVFKDF